jgi:hypothetical protein
MVFAAKMGCDLIRLILFFLVLLSAKADSFYIIVSGIGGTPEYDSQFAKWAGDLKKELENSGPGTHVTQLSGSDATRERIEQQLRQAAGELKPEDVLGVFLIGHGTFDGTDYKFNIAGPDITAIELANLLNRNPARRQLVVNMTSCSGASAAALAKTGRVVITATKSGTEKNVTVFPRFWIDALRDPGADTDKNGTLSTLEAFRYTERKTAAYYESEKLLATEHATLSDSASAKPVRNPSAENGQGLLAARLPLIRPQIETAESASPEKESLLGKKENLEAEIDKLKYQKAAMAPDEYKQRLTALLLELARTQAQIDK